MTVKQYIRGNSEKALFNVWDTRTETSEWTGDFYDMMYYHSGVENEEVIKVEEKGATVVIYI